ncbi:hypothetical protein ACFQRC_10415 [Enterovirga sp. GCM10030262]|uniref:hypothetical protein n=1 Tax=Enterovirga sp. GCM10030262 TaxID=3273391 RepID=UPI003610E263
MPRLLTRRQAAQNAAFLAELARTGNARLAARRLGLHRSTFTKRRSKHPAFATQWDAALVAAQAALNRQKNPPMSLQGRGTACKAVEGPGAKRPDGLRAPRPAPSEPRNLKTTGGEPTITRLRSGRLQLRLAPPGRMTKAAEQSFLRALSASANIRLSAAAAGFAHSSFYARARASRAFAREMRLALAMGYERLEAAMLMAASPQSHADDGWRRNDPPPIPPLTAGQALQLLCLHEKSVRQSWDQPHRRKRRGEPWETYTERLRAMWTAEKAREAEDAALRAAAREEQAGDWSPDDEPPPPELPALEQVTGWSKADPKKQPHNAEIAMFGGWRLSDWRKRDKG